MTAITPHTAEFGRRLCEALGIDSKRTSAIVLRCAAGEVVSVTVEQYVSQPEGDMAVKLLTEYTLVPKE